MMRIPLHSDTIGKTPLVSPLRETRIFLLCPLGRLVREKHTNQSEAV